MGVLLCLAETWRNPSDDPDQAWQRTGVLLPAQTYPAPTAGIDPRCGHRVIIFFARTLTNRYLFYDLADQSDLASMTDLIVVTPDGSRPIIQNGIRSFIADIDGSLTSAVGLHRPIDGGHPVGYVLVDSLGYIRFRTLDPQFGEHAWEMKLLLGGIP
jgi:hypothetical protein